MKVGDLVKIIVGVYQGKSGIIIDRVKSFPVVQVVIDGSNLQWFSTHQCEVLNESR
jgi:ribosomal protein L24|tara:strand:- start:941 stop:1108 length:168 start_codon:yes stop_codon:yes gene_type:complete